VRRAGSRSQRVRRHRGPLRFEPGDDPMTWYVRPGSESGHANSEFRRRKWASPTGGPAHRRPRRGSRPRSRFFSRECPISRKLLRKVACQTIPAQFTEPGQNKPLRPRATAGRSRRRSCS
jgi:hypothetical protein